MIAESISFVTELQTFKIV